MNWLRKIPFPSWFIIAILLAAINAITVLALLFIMFRDNNIHVIPLTSTTGLTIWFMHQAIKYKPAPVKEKES